MEERHVDCNNFYLQLFSSLWSVTFDDALQYPKKKMSVHGNRCGLLGFTLVYFDW